MARDPGELEAPAALPDLKPPVNVRCAACEAEPEGDAGHAALAREMEDTLLGHTIYRCRACEERWIRRAGFSGGYVWSRYSQQFAGRKRVA